MSKSACLHSANDPRMCERSLILITNYADNETYVIDINKNINLNNFELFHECKTIKSNQLHIHITEKLIWQ